MTRASSKQTRAVDVRNRIREDILSGWFKPGQRLMSPDLCARYDSSVGVTREALTWLEAQGLVRAQARQGHIVTPLSRSDLQDLASTRMAIEPVVLRLSVENRNLEWESRIVAAHHVMAGSYKLMQGEPSSPEEEAEHRERWAVAHAAFHEALFSACPFQRLVSIAYTLSEEAALYRRWSDALTQPRNVLEEHRQMMDAAIAGDADLAAELLRKHIALTARGLITYAND